MFDLKNFFEQNYIDYNGKYKRIKIEKHGIVRIDCRSKDFGGKEVKILDTLHYASILKEQFQQNSTADISSLI
ncbi:MAG: hypothetical protein HFG34_00275 [Eubacterium sp.]|nr:hypothetical protein [Eubacterium sp.]